MLKHKLVNRDSFSRAQEQKRVKSQTTYTPERHRPMRYAFRSRAQDSYSRILLVPRHRER